MMQVPDAPWIRMKELNGEDEGPDLTCPLCGHSAEFFVLDENHAVLGCNVCTEKIDVWDWLEKYGGKSNDEDD